MALIEIAGVSFAYDGASALADVALEVAPGEAVAVLGPNGAGKTTLLRVAAGFVAPSAGRAAFDGRSLASWRRRDLARRLAYVGQTESLLFPFRALDVVLMGRYPHRGLHAFETADDGRAAREAMERTDVWALRERRLDELSGGERRRVLLAQALCQRVEALLLDEPTAALDLRHQRDLLSVLAAERDRGVAVLAATHDLQLCARGFSRTAVLSAGRIVADGPTAAVLASPETAAAFAVPLHFGSVPGTGAPFCVPG
jgi:ABC-type cobalamin/Fe3+-siderophores transport system ATPase subunit